MAQRGISIYESFMIYFAVIVVKIHGKLEGISWGTQEPKQIFRPMFHFDPSLGRNLWVNPVENPVDFP